MYVLVDMEWISNQHGMRHDNALMKRIEGTSQEVQLQMG